MLCFISLHTKTTERQFAINGKRSLFKCPSPTIKPKRTIHSRNHLEPQPNKTCLGKHKAQRNKSHSQNCLLENTIFDKKVCIKRTWKERLKLKSIVSQKNRPHFEEHLVGHFLPTPATCTSSLQA